MEKRILGLILCLFLVICLMPITAFAVTAITDVEIMIRPPAHSEQPELFTQVYGTGCKLDTSVNTEGYQSGVRWRKISTGAVMGASDAFVGGELYELSVCLVANSGYTFSLPQSHITVNLDEASFTLTDTSRVRITIQLSAENLYVNSATITGLNAPKAGNTPDCSVTLEENNCETSIIIWYDTTDGEYMSDDEKFQAGHEYWVELSLKAKPGYEFPNNFYATLDGNSVSVIHNTGTGVLLKRVFQALDEEHTHTPSNWRTNQVYHYKACTTCGEMLEEEDHKGGKATCAEKGKCTVCGYAYIEETENHTPDTKWTACGNLYHAYLCKLCGAHCNTQDHVPGPAATDDTPQKCTVCGYVLVPAKNHTHKLTKQSEVPASCTEPGTVEHYACNGCDEKFADSEGNITIPFANMAIAPLGHTVSDEWEYDEEYHWRTCAVCEAELGETKMVHEMKDGNCTSCGYDGKTIQKDDESKQPQSKDDSDDTDSKKKTDFTWVWIVVVGIICLAVGITVPLLVVKLKKNKE